MIKKVCLLMVGLLQAVGVCAAGIPATTELGKKVLLFDNGTWEYVKTPAAPRKDAGKKESATPAVAERIELLKGKAVVSYDPRKWRNLKEVQPGRFEMIHKEGDVRAMIITERLQIPIDTLCKVALDNAREVAPDARIVLREQRLVNGTELTHLQIAATIIEIPFVYLGNYYAGKQGVIQMLVYTGENLVEENRQDIEELLAGLQIN